MSVNSNVQDASDEWFKSSMTLLQKWRIQYVKKKRGGLIPRGADTNKWTPWAFQFINLGNAAWMVFVAIPHYYKHDLVWLVFTEALAIYSFINIMINWLFICFTTSTYIPEAEHDDVKSEEASANEVSNSDLRENDNSESTTDQGNHIMLATNIVENKIERRSVPYWSWTPCVICQRKRPPRCHHCTLCNKCVLKRDHHCYFTRNCVGMYNQRYFIYFLFWCVIFTSLGCYQLLPYIFKEALKEYSYIDLFVPVNILKALFGKFPLLYCHLIIMMYGGLALTFLSAAMFARSFYLVLIGLTKFEYDCGFKIIDTQPLTDRLRSVMGQNWAIGLFIPGGASFYFVRSMIPASLAPSKPVDDPVRWPFIKLS